MDFRKDYNDGLIVVKDKDLLKEMKMYTEQDVAERGNSLQVTRHFDLLMSAVIGWAAQKYLTNQNKTIQVSNSIVKVAKTSTNPYGM